MINRFKKQKIVGYKLFVITRSRFRYIVMGICQAVQYYRFGP